MDLWRMGDRSLAWLQIHREGSWKLQLAGVWGRCWWRPYGKDTDILNTFVMSNVLMFFQVWRHTCVFIDFLGGRTAFFENGEKLFEKTGVKVSLIRCTHIFWKQKKITKLQDIQKTYAASRKKMDIVTVG